MLLLVVVDLVVLKEIQVVSKMNKVLQLVVVELVLLLDTTI